jgi:hypothetical protein
MRHLVSSTITLVVLAFAFAHVRAADRGTETYAVYSLLLNQITESPEDGSPVKLFVINSATSGDTQTGWSPQGVFQFYKYQLSPDFQSALTDYEGTNKQPQNLVRSFNVKNDYVFLNANDFHGFFKDNNARDNWRAFYSKYPNSPGYITVSRVGFDSNRTHALLYFEFQCGGLCADGSYRLLTKKDGVWTVTKRISFWMS